MTKVVKNVKLQDGVLKSNSATNDALQTIDIRGKFVWTDLRFSFTQQKLGANLKPDFDETNVGLLFPQNNATEIIYIIGQLPHEYRLGTDLKPHVHWQQSAAQAVTWKLDYKWFNNGDTIPANFTTISTSTGITAYTSGDLAQKSIFPAIDGSAITKVSSVLLLKLYREDNIYTGDALAFELDMHYQKDSMGSVQEYIK